MTTSPAPIRIAMWSGPRNISTAMMRSWGSRADTVVTDEPLYAHYLRETGVDHPGRDEVLAHHETDWREVVSALCGPLPPGKSVFYQKHMAHHLLADTGRDWLANVTSAFLVRDPEEMLTSLIRVTPSPTIDDTGLLQQLELFERVADAIGEAPPVLDARDVLETPRTMLELLCRCVGVPFDEAMLAWASGPRKTDGVWAKHWYASVERSSGFQPYRPKDERVPDELRGLLERCRGPYETLARHRIRPESAGKGS